ncbi:10972_t:CDS:2 [Acaulospora colombiana]|uniref:10972_t:CDS:1 n=1 Tax=Acaulospora colombiana TaxID=27376 RepID=A0ACA9P7X2_9GLOM|nr:10972_t:CDS:2 [Acaulospora colombiana]
MTEAPPKDPEYEYVIMLLNAKTSNPREKKYSSDFFEASISYVLKHFNANHAKHLLCTPELTDIVIEMIPLFLIENPDGTEVGMVNTFEYEYEYDTQLERISGRGI